MRKMIVADKFYEKNPDLLKKEIEKCFLSEFGPKEFCNDENKVKAIIAPHAGYFFSGACAAWAYKDLGESRTDDVYLIIGPNHTGRGITSITTINYETPFGEAQINQDFANKLIEEGISNDFAAHEFEHSIEVQLPFLHYVTNGNFTFVPLVVSGDLNVRRLSQIIQNAISKFDKDVKIIISSDFTHSGDSFNYNISDKIDEIDKKASELICNLDYIGFNEFLEETKVTICGAVPILVLLKLLEKDHYGEVLQYYKSSEILKQGEESVSYFAISFLEK